MLESIAAKISLLSILLTLLTTCAPDVAVHPTATPPRELAGQPVYTPTVTHQATATQLRDLSLSSPTQTPTPAPTSTPTATKTPGVTPSATISPTPVACASRIPDEGLLTLVTRDYGLSRDYEPPDLVPLSDYFGTEVTLGYPTEVRAVIVAPLQRIIEAMKDEGLAPQIVSGYRSYSTQALALQKWLTQYPDWARNLSAPPGHSEHQLGTTVDFGSPELKYMLGEDYVQFHPAFAQTSEGEWLSEHAADYGFTLSYPYDAFERTGFYYEPWHFRYVGEDLAMQLAAESLTISEFLEREQPEPCIAD